MESQNVERQGKGMAQVVTGRIKQAFARLFGSRRMEIQGGADEIRGRANAAQGAAAERAQGAAQQAGGAVEQKVGEALGSPKASAEGRAKELEGQIRHELGR